VISERAGSELGFERRNRREFEPKVATDAKTDQELGLRHHHSVESFAERDFTRPRMLLNHNFGANFGRPIFSTHLFASFATFCSNSLLFLLFGSRLVRSAWIDRTSRPSQEVPSNVFLNHNNINILCSFDLWKRILGSYSNRISEQEGSKGSEKWIQSMSGRILGPVS